SLLIIFGVVPLDTSARGTFWVEVVGCSGAPCSTTGTPDALVTGRAIVGFVAGQTLALHMFLSTACARVTCAANETCAAATGQCRTALVEGRELTPYVPGSERDASDISSPDATTDVTDAADVPVTTSRAIQVECSASNTCVRLEDSSVWCWGDNALGIVSDESSSIAALRATRRLAPEGPVVAASIASGGEVLCAIDSAAHVRCLGINDRGQLGTGLTDYQSYAFGTVGLEGVSRLDLGDHHACAIHGTGSLSCWGANDAGQLGNGGMVDSNVPVPALLAAPVLDVSVGIDHTCAVTGDHHVYCWGTNGSGQLGDGANIGRSTPVAVQGLVDAVEVETGESFSCATRSGGTVVCWGLAGQNGAATDTNVPGDVSGLAGVTSLSAGRHHACAVTSDHRVHCWGNNYSGALGFDTQSTELPVSSTTAGDVVAVSCGEQHTCAIRVNGSVACWGSDTFGQLGNGRSTAFTGTPVIVPMTPAAFGSLSVGQSQTAYGIAAGHAYSFGLGEARGELGPGVTSTNAPMAIPGLTTEQSICGGAGYACALDVSGSVRCWGDNAAGQLGNGSTAPATGSLTTVIGVSNARQLSCGFDHACVVDSTGSVTCWGRNTTGQLGRGDTAVTPSPAIATEAGAGIAEVRAGDRWTCVRQAGGSVRCWGANAYSQLGATAGDPSPTARTIAGLTSATQLALGEFHACATLTDGHVFCWGDDQHGALGDGSTDRSHLSATVTGLDQVTRVAVGHGFACALRADGSVWCWGYNGVGQLGQGDILPLRVPTATPVPGIVDATDLAADENTVCVLRPNGAWCWGLIPSTGQGFRSGYGLVDANDVIGLP
ncbi:MAG: hypothetical protein WCJ30_11935, partial [Deltaproteobacteria bacterium]